MNKPTIEPIPWKGGPEFYHSLFREEEGGFCLFSGGRGRFSYVGFHPRGKILIYPDRVEFSVGDKAPRCFRENPFTVLKSLFKKASIPPSSFLAAGWVGFLGYEMGGFADLSFPRRALPPEALIGGFGLYDPVLVFDHSEEKAWVSSWGITNDLDSDEKLAGERVGSFVDLPCSPHPDPLPADAEVLGKAKSNFTSKQYVAAVARVLEYLRSGDCYQVNLSQQFSFELSDSQDLRSLFWHRVKSHPAPFSAFLDFGAKKILSLSPEEFFSLRGNQIQTRPIKGTRRRSKDPQEDREILRELLRSPKDQAELLMIVDLERNDLGKICRPGRVTVRHLKEAESFDYVHHLVATVQGELQEGIGVVECLEALFPGGSITGAPKRRAMEIIQDLELFPRGVYTGAIGFKDFSPFAVFNIAIRTLEVENRRARFGVGGGIVADSDPQAEYEETLTKAKVFLE